MMPYFNLEEAIDCPPALVADIPAKFELFQENGSSLKSLSSGKTTQNKSESVSESVLSRWSDRVSIQSFMNVISTLSAQKQELQLKQQQQKQEMYDKFRQFMLQEQQKLAKQQQMEKNQQFLQPNSQQPPKFRKIMKGGALVTIPVNTRHPPAGMTVDQSCRGESGPSTNYDKLVNFGTGNILDDILARSQENDDIACKKAVMFNTADYKAKGEQTGSSKPGETANTLRSRAFNENVTDSCHININPSLAKSKPCHDQQEVKHSTVVRMPSLTQPDNIVLEESDSFNVANCAKESTCKKSSESGHENKQIVISGTASNGRGSVCLSEISVRVSKLDTLENTKTDKMNTNMKSEVHNTQGSVKHENASHIDSFENNHVNSSNTRMNAKLGALSPGKLVIDIDSDTELNTRVSKRAAKRANQEGYSSVTSESSGGEEQPPVSAFERIRSLCGVEESKDENKAQETTKVATGLENDCENDAQLHTTKPGAPDHHSPTTSTQEQSSLPPQHTLLNIKNIGVTRKTTKAFEEKREASVKKDVQERKRKDSVEEEYQIDNEMFRKKIKQNYEKDKLPSSAEPVMFTGRVTRSMAFSDVESPQENNREKRHEPSHSEQPQETSVEQVEETPSLLSMVSEEALDVTVAQQELSDKRKNHKRGGKKKRKKPTEWFLRQKQKEREMLQRRMQQKPPPPPRELPACLFFLAGKCAKGTTCQFKHEKIKELCRFYASHSCDKVVDGMCPNMHDEFPCMFFHKSQCTSGTTCKFSHAPLTDETREILKKHCAALEERRQLSVPVPPVSAVTADPAADVRPMQEKNETTNDFTAATSLYPGRPEETKTSDGGFPKPGIGLNSAFLTEKLPSVKAPKVKRLCSLSSYQPKLLSSLTSLENFESQPENVLDKTERSERLTSTRKSFLPGLFKER